jgi:hypothetical protein
VEGSVLDIQDMTHLVYMYDSIRKLNLHDAAAIRTKEYAGEQDHFIIAVGAFALLA